MMKLLHSLGGGSTNDYPLRHIWPAIRDGIVDYILRHCRSDKSRRKCKSSFLQVLQSSYTVVGFTDAHEKSELPVASFPNSGPTRFFRLVEHSNAVRRLVECLKMFLDNIARDQDFQPLKSYIANAIVGLRATLQRASVPAGRVFDKLQCLEALRGSNLIGMPRPFRKNLLIGSLCCFNSQPENVD